MIKIHKTDRHITNSAEKMKTTIHLGRRLVKNYPVGQQPLDILTREAQPILQNQFIVLAETGTRGPLQRIQACHSYWIAWDWRIKSLISDKEVSINSLRLAKQLRGS